MDRQEQMDRAAGRCPDREARPVAETSEKPDARRSPSWRGLVISVLLAIILSATTTLLLGGSLRPSEGGCAAGPKCSPAAVAANKAGNPAPPDETGTRN